jgi:DNA polymerase-1
MEICGLLIDPLKLTEIGEEFEVEANKYQDEVFMYAGEKFNLNSYKVLGEILFEKLKLPAYKKTKTGYSTNSEVLEKLAYRYPIAKAILEYRSYNKLITTYVNGLLEVKDENNYLHPIYKQALTTTGRLSSIEPNIQNIPIRTETGQTIRKVFVSRFKDGLILSADYSQIELRVLASLSEDAKMIEFYNQGLDIHRATAASIYGIDYNMINPSQRRDAKTINFGIIYGMSAWGLSEALNINPKDASDYIERYFEIFKGAKEFLDYQVAIAREKGYTKTLLNRRRYIDNINSPNINLRNFGERTAMNAPIQGTAADIIKLAMNKVKAKMVEAKLESLLIAQVHDELVFDVKPNELEVLKDIVKTEMENAIKLNVPLVIDINYGKNWYETK